MTIESHSTLAEIVGVSGDTIALTDDTTTRTWAELDTNTHRIGLGLEAHGLVAGDHVALIMTNRVEFVESMLGCIRAGLTMTPIKTNWTPAEISYLLNDAGSRAVITDLDVGRQAARSLNLPIVDVDSDSTAGDFAGWMQRHDGKLPAGRTGYRIPYTSGTTGQPKGVERTAPAPAFEQWVAGSAAASKAVGIPGSGVHLMVSQLFHGAPLNFGLGAMFAGATLTVMGRWDPPTVLDHFRSGPTSSIMVPTMFRQLLALPQDQRESVPVENVSMIFHGGEACPVALKRDMIDWWGPVFTEYYGFTEGGFTICDSTEWLAHPGTVGRPPPGQEIRILDDDLQEMPIGETGTVYFRRPDGQYFRYRNAPAKTAEAHLADNAFTVGDIGHVDADGYLYLSGRTAEVIVAAGVNVYPAEIEAVILDVDGVADACVAGGPDPERGEQPVAFVCVTDGAATDQVRAAIEHACATNLAGYKRPRRIVIREEIPRDPTGKLLRLKLRQELWPAPSA